MFSLMPHNLLWQAAVADGAEAKLEWTPAEIDEMVLALRAKLRDDAHRKGTILEGAPLEAPFVDSLLRSKVRKIG